MREHRRELRRMRAFGGWPWRSLRRLLLLLLLLLLLWRRRRLRRRRLLLLLLRGSRPLAQ